jgi:hypothetical protein
MSKYMIENLPQVVGKSLALISELIEGLGNWGSKECRNERFCIKRNFPSLPGLGMTDKGEVWKGPMRDANVSAENGPR